MRTQLIAPLTSGHPMRNQIEGAKTEKNTITTAIHGFDAVLERVTNLLRQLHTLSDRIDGGGHKEVAPSKTPSDTAAQSLLGAIHSRRSFLSETIDDMERIVHQLEQSI